MFIDRHEHHVFSFCLGGVVQQGLRNEQGLYVLFFCAKKRSTAVDIALSQGKLGDYTVIADNRDFFEVWIEVKPSTCPYWDIINEAALAEVEQVN